MTGAGTVPRKRSFDLVNYRRHLKSKSKPIKFEHPFVCSVFYILNTVLDRNTIFRSVTLEHIIKATFKNGRILHCSDI